MAMFNIKEIFSEFRTEGGFFSAEPIGSGHIHDTFIIKNFESSAPDYLLQRINNKVFNNVAGLMENIQKVTEHIQKKIDAENGGNRFRILSIINTRGNKLFYKDNEGNYWRLFNFIEGARSYDIVEKKEQAFQSGLAYGHFLALLMDLPPENLSETIPDFHNVEKRLQTFECVLKGDPLGRGSKLKEEIEFIKNRASEMKTLNQLGREGNLPMRITHNDTKLNNILFDKDEKFLSVIDLDTVMPGFIAYDFGDAIRTTATKSNEDEKDLNEINFDLGLYELFTEGFLKKTKAFLTPAEIKSLAFGAKLLTFIMGLRFFTDYLDGDKYYKIHFPGHNLQRAKAQFHLLKLMEAKYPEMQLIVEKHI